MSSEAPILFQNNFSDSLVLPSEDHRTVQKAITEAANTMQESPYLVREVFISNSPLNPYKPIEFSAIAGGISPDMASLYFSYTPTDYYDGNQTSPYDFSLNLRGKNPNSWVEIAADGNDTYWLRPTHNASSNPFWYASPSSYLLPEGELKLVLACLPLPEHAQETYVLHQENFALTAILATADSLSRPAESVAVHDTVTESVKQPGYSTDITLTRAHVEKRGHRRTNIFEYGLTMRSLIDVIIPAAIKEDVSLVRDTNRAMRVLRLAQETTYTFQSAQPYANEDDIGHTKNSYPAQIGLSISSSIGAKEIDDNSYRYLVGILMREKLRYLENPNLFAEKCENAVAEL